MGCISGPRLLAMADDAATALLGDAEVGCQHCGGRVERLPCILRRLSVLTTLWGAGGADADSRACVLGLGVHIGAYGAHLRAPHRAAPCRMPP
jgi:hypothetical protein